MSAPTINTYISDMLAVEQHIATPLEQQVNDSDVQALPSAERVVREALTTVQSHITQLESRLNAVGGHAGASVKQAAATVVGAAASAVNKVRKTEVSKNLRDDYTALSLASVGYTMLHTTALALGDDTTASLAKEHLSDVGSLIMKINSVIPTIVISELQQEGVPVQAAVSQAAEHDAQSAWKEARAKSGISN